MEMLPKDAAEKMQSFWKKPEGRVGAFVAALAGGGALVGLYKALPYIITLMQNTLYAAGLGFALFAVAYVLLDPKFRALTWYFYRSVMRTVTGLFIQLDPINILLSYVDHLKGSLSKMDQQIGNLNGHIKILKEKIKSNEAKAREAMSMASEAKKREKVGLMKVQMRQAGRLEESNVTYQDLLVKMEMLYRILQKMREVADTLIQDISGAVEVKIDERKTILATYSAFQSAMKIINGDKDKKAIFDQTMEYMTADYGMKLGEIENFIAMSSNFTDSVDIQNGVFEDKAMKRLEEWEERGDSLLLAPGEKKSIISAAYDPDNELSLDAPMPKRAPRPTDLELGGGSKYTDDLK